jgi:hypothetical protein
MNENLRFPIAILISLLFHIVLLMWIVHLVKVPAPHGQGPFQVFLRNGAREPGPEPVQLPASKNASSIKIPEARRTPPPAEASGPSSPFGNSDAPQFRAADMMNSMQLAQMAHQRELSRAAVMAQMSDIAARLRPLVSTSIICEQQKGGGIDCTPEPEGKLLLLLEQYSRLASEAHQMDVVGNPARIDFGQGLGVSVKLQP